MNTAIHAKLAKLLRMQTSSNVNEAANAARLMDRLCAEHGLDPDTITGDEDDMSLTAMCYQLGDTFARVDYAQAILLNAVANYYNGDLVITRCGRRESYFRIFCTEGAKVRIEVYYEYLSEVMDKLADKAKREASYTPRSFRQNFRKAFADRIGVRLKEMRREDSAVTGEPGLVRIGREKAAVADLIAKTCTGRMYSSTTTMGTGASAGREAAGRVGLGEQVRGGGRLALTGS